jgi:hypothetical protein
MALFSSKASESVLGLSKERAGKLNSLRFSVYAEIVEAFGLFNSRRGVHSRPRRDSLLPISLPTGYNFFDLRMNNLLFEALGI